MSQYRAVKDLWLDLIGIGIPGARERESALRGGRRLGLMGKHGRASVSPRGHVDSKVNPAIRGNHPATGLLLNAISAQLLLLLTVAADWDCQA